MDRPERKITKIGNSYGITIPIGMLKEAGMSYGENVEIQVNNEGIVLSKKEDIKLLEGISSDFFDVLEENIAKHEKTIRDLVDR